MLQDYSWDYTENTMVEPLTSTFPGNKLGEDLREKVKIRLKVERGSLANGQEKSEV